MITTETPNRSDIRFEASRSLEEIQKANQAAIDLIDQWMADESGYDESVWPQVELALEKTPAFVSGTRVKVIIPSGTPLLLDTGPLGKIAHPRRNPEIATWFRLLLRSGALVVLPEIADYEVRRNLILEDLHHSIIRLDGLKATLIYHPLTTDIMLKATGLWAQTRKVGLPTADAKELDGDVILAAQALDINGIVITDNTRHLARFVETRTWQEINL